MNLNAHIQHLASLKSASFLPSKERIEAIVDSIIDLKLNSSDPKLVKNGALEVAKLLKSESERFDNEYDKFVKSGLSPLESIQKANFIHIFAYTCREKDFSTVLRENSFWLPISEALPLMIINGAQTSNSESVSIIYDPSNKKWSTELSNTISDEELREKIASNTNFEQDARLSLFINNLTEGLASKLMNPNAEIPTLVPPDQIHTYLVQTEGIEALLDDLRPSINIPRVLYPITIAQLLSAQEFYGVSDVDLSVPNTVKLKFTPNFTHVCTYATPPKCMSCSL